MSTVDIPQLLTVGDVMGDFTVEAYLSQGGFAQVYRVTSENPRRTYAMKMLMPSADEASTDRFERECDILATLRTNHAPRVVFRGREHVSNYTDPIEYMVMDYVQGTSLERVMAQAQRVPGPYRSHGLCFCDGLIEYESCLALLDQILLCLVELHQVKLPNQERDVIGYVHRDLKPANIMLTSITPASPDLNVKVIDFGIAIPYTASRPLPTRHRYTQTGNIALSFDYTSPEQLTPMEKSAYPATDLFSLGLIVHELFVGRLPSHGLNIEQHLRLLLSEKSIQLPDSVKVPLHARRLIDDMLEPNTAKRLSYFEDLKFDEFEELQRKITPLDDHDEEEQRHADALARFCITGVVLREFRTLRSLANSSHTERGTPGPETAQVRATPEDVIQDDEDVSRAHTLRLDETHHMPGHTPDTQDLSFEVERLAQAEYATTQRIRPGLFDPTDDHVTMATPEVTPEQEDAYRKAHPHLSTEDTARLSDAAQSRSVKFEQVPSEEDLPRPVMTQEPIVDSDVLHEDMVAHGFDLSLELATPLSQDTVSSFAWWKVAAASLVVVSLMGLLIVNISSRQDLVEEAPVQGTLVQKTPVVTRQEDPLVVDTAKHLEHAQSVVHASQHAAYAHVLVLAENLQARDTDPRTKDPVVKKKVSSPKKTSQPVKKDTPVVTKTPETTTVAKKEHREDLKAVEKPKDVSDASRTSEAAKRRQELQRSFSDWKVD